MNSRLLIVSSVVTLLFGCSAAEEPIIRITGAFIPSESCTEGDVEMWRTNVDLATSNSAIVGFGYASDITAQTTTANGDELAGPQRNDLLVDELEISYESPVALPSRVSPVYGYIENGAESFIVLNLLTSEAVVALATSVLPNDPPIEVIAKLRLRGQTSVGQKFESREIRYPISVYNSGKTCPNGTEVAANGPCGAPGGQGNAPIVCETDATP